MKTEAHKYNYARNKVGEKKCTQYLKLETDKHMENCKICHC